MNERFLIPAAVAATLHAVLFFAFGTGEIPALSTAGRAVVSKPPPETLKVEWTAPDDDRTSSPEAGKTAAEPPPDIPEPPPRETDSITQITLPRESPHITSISAPNRIPTSSFTSGEAGPRVGPGNGSIIPSTALDNLPRTRAQLAPAYPDEARRNGRAGEVLVEFIVDENGRVLDPHVMRSNDPIFDAPTLHAVAKWRFEPGRKNGRVVRFRMAVPVAYAVNP